MGSEVHKRAVHKKGERSGYEFNHGLKGIGNIPTRDQQQTPPPEPYFLLLIYAVIFVVIGRALLSLRY